MMTPAPDQQYREDFRTFCVNEADPRVRPAMLMLYDAWGDYSRSFFGDSMTVPYILIAPTVSPAAYGDCRRVSDFGGTMQITIKRTLIDGTHAHFEAGTHDRLGQERFVLDVLLHEVVHQYCIEVLGKPEDSEKGHGLIFASECTRVGGLVGLPAVGPARAGRRKPGVASCGQWPHNVRPSNYYRGAYAPNGVQVAPTVPPGPGPGAPDPRVAQLEAEVIRLKAELSKTEGERDQARADLAQATTGLVKPAGEAELALFTLLKREGVDVWRDGRRLAGLLRDYLPDQPLEVSLLVAATKFDLASLTTNGAFADITRVRLMTKLVSEYGIAPTLADWSITVWRDTLLACTPSAAYSQP